MCGIAGFVGNSPASGAQEIGRRMLGAVRHRGPDQFGIYHDRAAMLGSARLSIVDLVTGQQPICNEDGTLWIVFNGEIFNHPELRPGLEARGHRFTTTSDTEVLLHLYEEEGSGCLRQLNGQFAAAIWDARERELFLARDRLGIRPLYYAECGGAFVFASEIKALLCYPGMPAEIDPASLDQVFQFWSVLPGRSVFRDIRELPSGHFMTVRGGCARAQRYWSMQFDCGARRSEHEYLEEFGELLTDATAIRLRADVPVAAYLSGGLDSSTICAIVRKHAGRELETFSIAFSDPDFDESEFQMRTASSLSSIHRVVKARHEDIARVFPDVVWHTETPVMRTAPAPMFLLSGLVREQGYKVVLTGEGADEVLAGYDIFKEAMIRRFWARQPDSRLRPLLLRRLYGDIAGFSGVSDAYLAAFFREGLEDTGSHYYSHLVRWRNNTRTRRFFSAAVRPTAGYDDVECPPGMARWGALAKAQYLESSVFLSEYLLSSQGDRVAMAHSVEGRMPFLDYRVVEFCNRLPADMKLRRLTEKHLLRRFARGLLPEEIWRRPKRPYRAPIHRGFFHPGMPEYVRELLSPERVKRAGLFHPGAVSQLVSKIDAGRRLGETDDMALAGILSTQLVHRMFVESFRPAPPLSGRDDVRVCAPALAAARQG